MFLMCFYSLLLRKRVLLDFLDFFVGTFFILQILLLKVASIVSFFVLVNSFHFHRHIVVLTLG